MIIDPSTDLGRLRLRCADYSDLPLLPDSVYLQTIEDKAGNLPEAAKMCAMYILGMLSQKTHRKLAQMETWNHEAFEGYKEFLMLTYTNPAFMTTCPIPYVSTAEFSPILDFQRAWNSNFTQGTSAQQESFMADISPNNNTRLGVNGLRHV